MSDMTVKDFAVKVGRDVPRLLEQMKEAGLKHASESDAVSEDDKQTLLSFLKKSHGGGDSEPSKNRITLTRKTRSRIKTGERGKTIEVQVRKKKTYVKREDDEKPKAPEPKHSGPRQLVGDMAEAEAERKARDARVAEEKAAAAKAKAAEDAARKEAEEKAKAKAAEVPDIEVPELEIDDTPVADDLPPAPPKEGRTDRRTAPPKKAAAKKKGRDDDDDRGDREERKRGGGKKVKRAERRGGRRGGASQSGNGKHGFQKPTQPIVREVSIPESISVAELADKMSIKANEVIKAMFTMGA
ncbi:MAG TPA: translation initiation factor IF-2, partial [Halomonas sp.]|nr:translation initiation factor IF-2 [Halomonas sp.]